MQTPYAVFATVIEFLKNIHFGSFCVIKDRWISWASQFVIQQMGKKLLKLIIHKLFVLTHKGNTMKN